jgi:transcriptional regulator with XRE-family HTH domain
MLPDMNTTIMGPYLRAMRLERGLTQTHLAAMTGVRPQAISRLERGETRLPRLTTLAAITRALEVDLDRLLGHESDAPGGS